MKEYRVELYLRLHLRVYKEMEWNGHKEIKLNVFK